MGLLLIKPAEVLLFYTGAHTSGCFLERTPISLHNSSICDWTFSNSSTSLTFIGSGPPIYDGHARINSTNTRFTTSIGNRCLLSKTVTINARSSSVSAIMHFL